MQSVRKADVAYNISCLELGSSLVDYVGRTNAGSQGARSARGLLYSPLTKLKRNCRTYVRIFSNLIFHETICNRNLRLQ